MLYEENLSKVIFMRAVGGVRVKGRVYVCMHLERLDLAHIDLSTPILVLGPSSSHISHNRGLIWTYLYSYLSYISLH
jgi:hypothetical protein